MHAYVITAQPTRWQRSLRAVRRWAPRLLIGAGLFLLGAAVFVLRAARAVLNLAAYVAARAEFAAAAKAGRQPVGQCLGVGVADAFTAEFHRGWVSDPA
jgi:hypothetical protein